MSNDVDVLMEDKMKKFWKSKTLWLNLIAVIIQALGVNPVEPTTSIVALGVANAGLRLITNKSLTLN